MSLCKRVREKGLSLKATSTIMLIVSLTVTVMLLIAAARTFGSYRRMESATDDYISMQDATAELMNASDYLTEEVQCYTVIGERQHMENYFTEAEVTLRREHAINTMSQKLPDSSALNKLLAAMSESVSLMDREYYAMRLMMEAQGDTDYPEAIRKVTLSEADSALSPEKKKELAQQMVHDAQYYEQKNRIRSNMAECVAALKDTVHGDQQRIEAKTREEMIVVAALIILQSLTVLLVLWLTTRLGVNPVLRAVDHIRKDQTMPIVGAAEFRYLAGTYNAMYNAYKKSIANLNFKASHDELTGVYNRAGYDLIKSSLDMSSTAMILFDADRFKAINDSCGHETGDVVLKKIASVLKANFRSDDYICRIGGDEFVTFMVHINSDPRILIEHKVMQINQDLQDSIDGVPAISLSAGVALGSEENRDATEMFRQSDTALYFVKDHGRNGCCFYTDDLKGKFKPEPQA